jgi:hypothetical protein
MLPQVIKQCFDGWKASAVDMKLSKREISPGHTPSAVQCISCIIIENRRVIIDELQLATSLCCATIHAITKDNLKMKKICTHWAPQDLMPKQKERMMQNCHKLLAAHNKDPEGFFPRVVTDDESWFHYPTTQMKSQSMQ